MPRRICFDLYDERDGYWYADQNQFDNRYIIGNSGMNQPNSQANMGMNRYQPNSQLNSGINQTSNRTNTGMNQ